MDALVTAFVAAALAEWGDKTQLLVALLVIRYGRPGAVLAGFALAALVSSVVAAVAGTLINDMITIRAMTMMIALALLFAGVAGLIRKKVPEVANWKGGAFVVAAALCMLAEFADRTQFLTFAIAGRFDSAALAAAGATAGLLTAGIPAALLGERLQSVVPVNTIRYVVAGLFLVTGFIVAVNALQLT